MMASSSVSPTLGPRYTSSSSETVAPQNPCTVGGIQALNTVAVEYLDYGQVEAAATAFSAVMHDLSNCLLAPAPLPPSSKDRMSTREEEDFVQIQAHVSDSDRSETEPRSLVFDRPFLFQSNLSKMLHEPDLSSQQHKILVITSLYNLALCHQLEYMKRLQKTPSPHHPKVPKTADARLLLQALYYYEQAYSMILANDPSQGRPQEISISPTNPVLPVLMALCTNATAACAELGQVQHIDTWNTRLIEFLHYRQVDLEEDVEKMFTLNAFLHHFPIHAAKAA